ncbi:cytochrome ubiquinol oxidase subunit I [Parvibacter caecicola]|uniref:cytochrome ubiquinol oxidase subunit I n=1 Tax=Parvibacter caecicola TaxID=747645 RepID=UPI0027316644|nr:cytochrome ubiquinol oxidase subunit I [Parvibacter caecicola]
MEIFSDVVLLSRFQFALTVAYHFLFVPLSIGLGLILAINETRYFRTRDQKDAAAAQFWVKVFTATFAIGVATGITMEFSFGTNWANYSRFVGDIFGAPLAAEALFAFFLESVFLGVLLFGRKKVSPRFYMVSAWLVWFGSCLSALWILIANSWMQTPAGGVLNADGTEAVITDFFAAAFNPSIFARYTHTVDALLIMGAFCAVAVAAWYLLKGRHQEFAMKTMRIGAVVGIITSCLMIVFAHASAVVVYEEQPTKLAMMEGMYESEVPPLYAIGIVDEENQEVLAPFAIPGGTSFLATGTWDTEYPGLNELAETEQFGDMDVDELPVGLVFQSYHIMVAMYGLIMLTSILVLIFTFKGGRIAKMRWLQWLALLSPIWPFIAIQTGWITAEVGRQPWVVYPSVTGPEGVSLLTADGISVSVSNWELLLTIGLFIAVYLILLVGWVRVVGRFIKEGPVSPAADGQVPVVATVGAADNDAPAVPAESLASAEVAEVVQLAEGEDGLPPFATIEEAKDAAPAPKAADAPASDEGRE